MKHAILGVSLLPILLASILAVGPLFAEPPPQTDCEIRDKTLVAWIHLANTTQRAGAALTLIDKTERFDAIVFAEKEPGKWMAGSDFRGGCYCLYHSIS